MIFSGCENGMFNQFDPGANQVDGKYDICKFEVNGVDSTIAYKSKPCFLYFLFIYDKDDRVGKITYWENGVIGCYNSGEWDLNEPDDNKIRLTFHGNSPSMGPWGGQGNSEWNVTKLENKEMIFEITENSIHYKIILCEI